MLLFGFFFCFFCLCPCCAQLHRFALDALETNLRFERAELDKRARQQADRRLKAYRKSELRKLMADVKATQRKETDYQARKKHYKSLADQHEAKLINDFAVRQASMADEHNEQLLQYHAYRHARLQAIHLREVSCCASTVNRLSVSLISFLMVFANMRLQMQKLLETHQSQRLELKLRYVDERQQILLSSIEQRRSAIDSELRESRELLKQTHKDGAQLRLAQQRERLQQIDAGLAQSEPCLFRLFLFLLLLNGLKFASCTDVVRQLASQQSNDETAAMWLEEHSQVMERRREQLVEAFGEVRPFFWGGVIHTFR